MNAEFNWWLLIVGLVLGAALTWLVMAESTRRDADVTESEQRGESLWIASVLSASGTPTEGERVEEILRLHHDYLAAPPPDEPIERLEPAEPPAEAGFAAPTTPLVPAAPAEPPTANPAPVFRDDGEAQATGRSATTSGGSDRPEPGG